MVRELSLVKGTDQFTFIRNLKVTPLTVDSDQFSTSNLSPESPDSLAQDDLDSHADVVSKQLSDQQVSNPQLPETDLSDRQEQDSSALQTINQQKLSSHLSLTNHPISISDRWYQPDSSNPDHSLFVPDIFIPPLETNEPIPQNKSRKYLDKILVVAALSYCGLLGWSLLSAQNSSFPLALWQRNQPQISQADLDFLGYIEESLSVIDSNPDQQQQSTTKKANKDDLVYLPVYTPTPPVQRNNNFPIQPNSLLPPPPPANNFAAFNPPVASIKKPAPPAISSSPTSPSPVASAQTSNPSNLSIANSQLPKLDNPQQSQAQKVAPQAAIQTPATIQPTLVGIIELKTNSAALFNLNGNTEKIWLGDQVGNTGWKLVSVTNQKANISYQGKDITLGIGQSFNATR